jgi:hypothetical protein
MSPFLTSLQKPARKQDVTPIPLSDRYDRLVQETYLCPEFERRIPGTGYRG